MIRTPMIAIINFIFISFYVSLQLLYLKVFISNSISE
jgi:hypothetical protein